MDIEAIARRVGLSRRKVRYVLDQQLLPGTRGKLQTNLRGQPRSFTGMEAFYIACAALMLEGGIKRGTVREVMMRLATMPWPLSPGPQPATSRQREGAHYRTAIEALYYDSRVPTSFQIGDGVNLRLVSKKFDTGWVEPRSWALLRPEYSPQVSIAVHLGQLWTKFGPAAQ